MSTKTTGNFGKIFESLFERSLVGKGAIVFAVMSYVIAKQQPVGKPGEQRMEVTLHPGLLGPILGESPGDVQDAIEILCSEDPDTNTPDENGKRLVKIAPYDYWVVNGMKYRNLRQEEARKVQNREAQQRFREKTKSRKKSTPLSREQRYVAALERGDQKTADFIASEGLPPTPSTELEPPPAPMPEL